MLQHLVILLDDSATSYCHYDSKKEGKLISLEDLKAGILFAMKQNLMIQFVYPVCDIPAEHKSAIETIDHIKMMPIESLQSRDADVLTCNSFETFIPENMESHKDKIFVVRSSKASLFRANKIIADLIESMTRLNFVLTDPETFTDEDFVSYEQWLEELGDTVEKLYCAAKVPQINLLTDRILLKKMNNCNAGVENITLAPNGKFYICPAFYFDHAEDSIGNVSEGIDIRNVQLYKLDSAPLCRNCDAYQCKRCVWLNRKTTLEVNTPSHEQCVIAHLERNAAEKLCNKLKPVGYFADTEIKSIDYLDPFEVREKF